MRQPLETLSLGFPLFVAWSVLACVSSPASPASPADPAVRDASTEAADLQPDPALEAAPSRPDILLLMADQLRADVLGCAGHAGANTPHLDRLAAEGALFRRAYTSTPSCTPARAALLTGRSPWGHGMLGYHRVAESYPVELPRLLADAGYRTHAIGKNHFHPQRNRHGYHTVELDESGRVEDEAFVSDYRAWFAQAAPGLDPDETGLGWNDHRSRPYALPEELHPTTWTGDRAVEFLREHDDERPFLLKVSFARPHSPYDPPQRLLDLQVEREVRDPATGDWSEATYGSIQRPRAYRAARNNLGLEVVRASRRAYDASLAFVDEQIGRILESLERSGRLENTLIVFLSDHGDMLGDHHLWRKALPYDGSVRIPMIVRWGSDLLAAPRGQVRDELVEIRDVLPTLLDGASLPVPTSVEGRSLLDPIRAGENSGTLAGWREVLDLEHATTYWQENTWTALVDERWKYIHFAFDGTEQLFDLANDPLESVNLAGSAGHTEELDRWRAHMVEHLAPRGEPWVVRGSDGLELGLRQTTILTGSNYPPGSP